MSRREESGYLYIKVQLSEFVYPRHLKAFKDHLIQALGQRLPSLIKDHPESTRDGAYALFGDDVFNSPHDYLVGDEAWTALCDELSKTRAFATTAEQSPLFLRVDVRPSGTCRRIEPMLRRGISRYELAKGERYDIVTTYRFPRQRSDNSAQAELQLQFGDNLRSIGPSVIPIDSHTNSIPSAFISKRYIEDAAGSISLCAAPCDGGPKLLFAQAPLQYELGESARFWVKAACALVLFSIAAALIGVDFSTLSPLSFRRLVGALWPKLLFGALQSGALFWILRLIGKKVV